MERKYRNSWLILTLTCVAQFFATLNWLNFTPLIVTIMREFNIAHSQAGLLVTASIVLAIFFQYICGNLADKYGAGRVLAIVLIVIFFPSLLTGVAQNFVQMFVVRLLAGLALGVFPVGSGLVAEWFPKRQMGLAQGIFGGTTATGLAFSAYLMPILTEMFSWRNAFILSSLPLIPIGLVFLFLFRYKDVSTLANKASKPLRPSIQVLRSPQVWYVSWLNFAFFGSFSSVVSWLPAYFSEEYYLSIVVAGTLVAISLGIGSVARPLGGFASDRFSKNLLLIISTLSLAVFYLMLGLRVNIALSVIGVFLVSWFVMFGAGALFRLPPILFPNEVGTVVGFASTFGLSFGGLLLPPIEGLLIDRTGSYAAVFYLLALISLLNTIGAIKIRPA